MKTIDKNILQSIDVFRRVESRLNAWPKVSQQMKSQPTMMRNQSIEDLMSSRVIFKLLWTCPRQWTAATNFLDSPINQPAILCVIIFPLQTLAKRTQGTPVDVASLWGLHVFLRVLYQCHLPMLSQKARQAPVHISTVNYHEAHRPLKTPPHKIEQRLDDLLLGNICRANQRAQWDRLPPICDSKQSINGMLLVALKINRLPTFFRSCSFACADLLPSFIACWAVFFLAVRLIAAGRSEASTTTSPNSEGAFNRATALSKARCKSYQPFNPKRFRKAEANMSSEQEHLLTACKNVESQNCI